MHWWAVCRTPCTERMSTRRRSRGAGWVNPQSLAIGPNGRRLCRRCQQEVPAGRITFCSMDCVHEWKVRTDPYYVRQEVFKRDQGVCAACGVDTMEGQRRKRARGSGHLWQADHIVPVVEGGGECGLDGYRTLCTDCHKAETAELRKRLAGNGGQRAGTGVAEGHLGASSATGVPCGPNSGHPVGVA